MDFPGAHNVRRRPQGLGVARDVSSPRIGDLWVGKRSWRAAGGRSFIGYGSGRVDVNPSSARPE